MAKPAPTFKAGAPRRAVLVLIAVLTLPAAAEAAPLRAAVFPFELDDTSLQGAMQGAQPAEQARLARLDAQLRVALAASGGYTLVDTAPVAAQVQSRSLQSCDTCAADLAHRLGAAVAVNGWVQKVSPLILNINLIVRDAATNKMLRAGSVDIRGDTDESWTRGLAWLLKRRILADQP